ncbi:type-1 angiotensin II receptor-associated protein-like isoform X1 [Polyodon spathula]|uniref:type-1 angiotensin II receptor-associated protein-like isoform X1 n=2 Tax=Polyodon spathula TaxID=7913 RepID=UPI001B7F4E1A|nr:type-1 angiotensin II receptor-associated protein-like isoform X1 [Polyodon spathula]
MEIPAINLKAIVLVHWLLTIWGFMYPWLPVSYAWSNVTVLAIGVWAVAQRDSIDAVLLFLIGMSITILTDIIHFGIYYNSGPSLFRFCAGMAILSLILKPASCFFVYQMYRERGGEYVNFGLPSMAHNRDCYQSIDQQNSGQANSHYAELDESKAGPQAY